MQGIKFWMTQFPKPLIKSDKVIRLFCMYGIMYIVNHVQCSLSYSQTWNSVIFIVSFLLSALFCCGTVSQTLVSKLRRIP